MDEREMTKEEYLANDAEYQLKLQTAKKIALLLSESGAKVTEIENIFRMVKRELRVSV